MTERDRVPNAEDVPGFDRATNVDDPVPRREYGDQEPELELELDPDIATVDGGPVDDLHELLLEVLGDLEDVNERVPDPLTVNTAIRDVRDLTDVYGRLDETKREGGARR